MKVNILGTRGVPASHGGFETFAARLAPFLTTRGHEVLAYCQAEDGPARVWREDDWNGVRRRHFRPRRAGGAGTVEFDLAATLDVLKEPGVDLVLGYNTAVFSLISRLAGRRVFMNMDGIEWQRAKWSLPAKAWFFVNELLGANIAQHPIADHPEIAAHLARRSFRRATVIPYGADRIKDAPTAPVTDLGLRPGGYFLSVARIEPENSILEIVRAHAQAQLSAPVVVLGRFEAHNPYHQAVHAAAGPDAVFPGAIYDPVLVGALRFHALAYLHGHQVGGTNPSLVEALGAGNAVIAHDNRFNRWTAGPGQFFFSSEDMLAEHMARLNSGGSLREKARAAARARHAQAFGWDRVLGDYEALLARSGPLGRDRQKLGL